MSELVIPYGPTLTELHALVENEKAKRRRIRLLQVRAQARQSAKRIRHKYYSKKETLISKVASAIQASMDQTDQRNLYAQNAALAAATSTTGRAHLLASSWNDPGIKSKEKLAIAHQRAAERYQIASRTLREEQRRKEEDESEPRNRLISVRQVERQRAQLVAALPKPQEDAPLIVPVPAQHVVVCDLDAKTAGHVQTTSSTARVIEHSVDVNAMPRDPQSAAQRVMVQLEDEQRIKSVQAHENQMKAELRGQQAIKRERIRRHYQMLLSQLEECGRADIVRRRSEFDVMTSIQHEEQKTTHQMEKAFEREILNQIASDGPPEDSLPTSNSLEHAVQAVRFSEQKTNAERLVNTGPPTKSSEATRPVLSSCENQMEMVRDTNGTVTTNIPKWTFCVEENSVSTKFAQRLNTPTKPALETPPVSKPKQILPPTPSFESTLGPGERPVMPSVRLVFPKTPVEKDHVHETKTGGTTERNVVRVSQEINCPQSSEDGDASFESVQSKLRKQQTIVDKELQEIDRRLAEIKKAAALDTHLVGIHGKQPDMSDSDIENIGVRGDVAVDDSVYVNIVKNESPALSGRGTPLLTHLSPAHRQQLIKLVRSQLESGFVSSRSSDESSARDFAANDDGGTAPSVITHDLPEQHSADEEVIEDMVLCSVASEASRSDEDSDDASFKLSKTEDKTWTISSVSTLNNWKCDEQQPCDSTVHLNDGDALSQPVSMVPAVVENEAAVKMTSSIDFLARQLTETALRDAQIELADAPMSTNVVSAPESSPSSVSCQQSVSDPAQRTSDSLKAEIHALLTSTLISGLNGKLHSTNSTGLDVSSSISRLLQRLMDSQNSGDPNDSSRQKDKLTNTAKASSGSITSPSSISSAVKTASDEKTPTEPVESPYESDPREFEHAPSVSSKVNKDWLLSLAGQSSSSKASSSTTPTTFRALSPADGQSDGSTIEATIAERSTLFEKLLDSSSTKISTKLPPSLSTIHPSSTSFKPLPRLDEAVCEESTVNISHDATTPMNSNDKEFSFRTPSSSWTDSRRSSDFMTLSRCSTSNSNRQSSSTTDDPATTDTTLHQLRNNVPDTPLEPIETAVAPFLGSNMSSLPSSHWDTESLLRELMQTSETDYRYYNLPPMVRLARDEEQHSQVLPTRNTTTIDSAWDEAESSAREWKTLATETAQSSSLLKPPQPLVPIIAKYPDSPVKKTKTDEPRPSTPAEGAISARCPSNSKFVRKGDPVQHNFHYQSLPTILVDCVEPEESSQIIRPKNSCSPHKNSPLFASWSNFAPGPTSRNGHGGSTSDSLRSFRENEARCVLPNDPPMWDVFIPVDDAVAYRSVRRKTTTQPRRTAARSFSKPAVPSTTSGPSRCPAKATKPAPVSVATVKPTSSNVVQSKVPKRTPSFTRPKNEPRHAHGGPAPTERKIEQSAVNVEITRSCMATKPALPRRPGPRPASKQTAATRAPTTSAAQSIRDEFNRWRAARLAHTGAHEQRDTSPTNPTMNTIRQQTPCLSGSNEHVEFSAVYPGLPPTLLECSRMEDTSSDSLWMNGLSMFPTLQHRPSSPTPMHLMRLATSSEDTSLPLSHLLTTGMSTGGCGGLSSEALSAACAGDEIQTKGGTQPRSTREVRFADQPSIEGFGGRPRMAEQRSRPRDQSDSTPVASSSTSYSTTARSAMPLGRPSQERTRQERDEQARQNRLRVKEFDRMRREKIAKHSRPKKVTR